MPDREQLSDRGVAAALEALGSLVSSAGGRGDDALDVIKDAVGELDRLRGQSDRLKAAVWDAARLASLSDQDSDVFEETPPWDDLYDQGMVRMASDPSGERWSMITRKGLEHLTALVAESAPAFDESEATK